MIEVQGLSKRYGARPALVDVTFSVPRGQVLGFLGPNGAGKSTAMRILTGYLGASGGSASIDGLDLFSQSREVRRRVGYLPEVTPLYGEMRVEAYLRLVCRLRGVRPSQRQAQIDRAIEACGLTERRRDIIGRLSRGLRQRVGLAQAVVHDPAVLILDEPTAGLDPAQTKETRDLITELGHNHTVVLSSHVLSEVQATCQRVVIIDRGRLIADDTPEALSARMREAGAEVQAIVRGEPESVERTLRQIEGVRDVRLYPVGEGERAVTVTSTRPDLQDAIARAVVGAGLGLRELRTRSLSLEDVFLQVVGEARQPAEAPGPGPAAEPA
ncbi:MAG: ABC transporter ATP-binding protein, partial [Candidatus Dormibacteraeota bacterium]|nr:ABC transporter ATP-binding protein [Candidatus Dormibacteraeota bacterium]